MADKVRVLIETLKNDILYFVRKGVFSKEDVKLIMKQREVYEYILCKKNFLLSEHLKVIQFEIDLEKKRIERFKEL